MQLENSPLLSSVKAPPDQPATAIDPYGPRALALEPASSRNRVAQRPIVLMSIVPTPKRNPMSKAQPGSDSRKSNLCLGPPIRDSYFCLQPDLNQARTLSNIAAAKPSR